MQIRDIIVANPHGLHMRVAARVTELVRRYGSTVRLRSKDNQVADGNSIMELLILGAEKGTPVRLEVEGPGEEQTANALVELFSDGAGI